MAIFNSYVKLPEGTSCPQKNTAMGINMQEDRAQQQSRPIPIAANLTFDILKSLRRASVNPKSLNPALY